MSNSRYLQCPKHFDTYFKMYERCPKCLEEATKERAMQACTQSNFDSAMQDARPKLEALMFLLEQGKYSIKLTSEVGEPDQFYVRIKSDEEDEGDFYDGEQLIRLSKSEGWNG